MVTGATDGIGLVTAQKLAERGARVLVVGRNDGKGTAALATIRKVAPAADLAFYRADLSHQADIRRMALQVREAEPQLDVLVNNAGAFFAQRRESADGIEMTFALNHLGYFLLTLQLLDLLRAAQAARVVNVASRAHVGARLDFDDLQGKQHYRGWLAYQRSKLANIMFTRALARRLKGSRIAANALHPGFVRSNFGNDNSAIVRVGLRAAMSVAAIGVEDGARTSLYLADSPEVEGKSGGYYAKCAETQPTLAARDDVAGERLWQISEAMVGPLD